ncbi:MAG: FecCD family ABC transporter permease [Crocinitomicaceae bacterium]
MTKKKKIIVFTLVTVTCLLVFFNLITGAARIPLGDVLSILSGEHSENPAWSYIVENRLYRSITAIVAGGGLAVCGLILQVFFRNPLAGPGVLGVTSGASLGVGVIMLGGIGLGTNYGSWLQILAGLIGTLLILILLMFLARFIRSSITLLVIGLMLVFLTGAIIDVLYLWANDTETRSYVLWGLGSFEGLSAFELWSLIGFVLIPFFATLFLVKPLNALLLGQAYAESVGTNIKSTRLLIIGITGIVAAAITVYCGPISFIGIAVPQLIMRVIKSPNHAVLLPIVFLAGATLGIAADITVRWSSNMLPLNTVTALIGAPVILWIIIKLNKSYAEV